ncbi:hypothetical protein [Streptomyces sp. NPDC127084]|uniref:hypothetical protein n=1 Tax=Streptomyces sp. NPDC127084 TaxID=3347133 RepID=UPI003648BF6F
MPRGRRLPPPPPPEALRSWPDREALLADRAAVLGDLTTRLIGIPRLLVFLLQLAMLQLGWGIAGSGLASLGPDGPYDPLSMILIVVAFGIATGVLVPAGLLVGSGIGRDRRIRALLDQWAALDRDPAGDARFRAPGPSLCWLLSCFVFGAFGLWLSFAIPASAQPGATTYGEVAYFMGVGVICWVMGLIGAAKAVTHYRWALRLTAVDGPASRTPVSNAHV